jgi:opacity protein-like surface antigen
MNRTLLTGLLALSLNAAFAADMTPLAEPADKLAGARAQISAKNWAGAIDELKRVNDTGSADWNNLMGYSLRKQKTPDLAGSEKYYNDALRIDPQHRGTLAYSGELYLTKGDLAMAERRLATLDKACKSSCAEYTELKNSIERYKANGNKVVAGSSY